MSISSTLKCKTIMEYRKKIIYQFTIFGLGENKIAQQKFYR